MKKFHYKSKKTRQATLRLQKLRTCGGNSPCIQSTLAVPGISLPGEATLLVGTSVFFIGTIRPRKMRVPAVRSRRLYLPQAAAARSPVNSRGMRLCAVEWFEPRERTKEKADYRMVVCFSLAPPVGLEPTTLRLTAACSAD